ncbi:hypothetical protein U3516DRAFT_914524 [Neocallimastix sp. 'constans']
MFILFIFMFILFIFIFILFMFIFILFMFIFILFMFMFILFIIFDPIVDIPETIIGLFMKFELLFPIPGYENVGFEKPLNPFPLF